MPRDVATKPKRPSANIRRHSEKLAEDLVVTYETARGWECERVGHLKIGFDVRSLGPADPQTGYRDPVEGIRRIEVKGRTRGFSIRLTTNEWYKAAQPTPRKRLRSSGGYRDTCSFQTATIIYDATYWFCERFLDPRSRTVDQMVQAARSGRQNIAEGSRAAATSSQTELRLLNTAR